MDSLKYEKFTTHISLSQNEVMEYNFLIHSCFLPKIEPFHNGNCGGIPAMVSTQLQVGAETHFPLKMMRQTFKFGKRIFSPKQEVIHETCLQSCMAYNPKKVGTCVCTHQTSKTSKTNASGAKHHLLLQWYCGILSSNPPGITIPQHLRLMICRAGFL